jgi:hypothetical protein
LHELRKGIRTEFDEGGNNLVPRVTVPFIIAVCRKVRFVT